MRLSNLTGPSMEVEPVEIIEKFGLVFFWYCPPCLPESKGHLSEKRTGGLVFRGTRQECRHKLEVLFMTSKPSVIKKKFSSRPSVEELDENRQELLKLHSQWRRLKKEKLPRELNENSWAGDLYVSLIPAPSNARERKIISQIIEHQERKFENA